MTRAERLEALEAACRERIICIDGAMGTQIQTYKLAEDDYRGERFADWSCSIQGNNEALNLSKPELIAAIHAQFFDAGADMIETNTFSATQIAQADYKMESLAAEIAAEGARIARQAADEREAETGEPKAVLGAIGPTTRHCPFPRTSKIPDSAP